MKMTAGWREAEVMMLDLERRWRVFFGSIVMFVEC